MYLMLQMGSNVKMILKCANKIRVRREDPHRPANNVLEDVDPGQICIKY